MGPLLERPEQREAAARRRVAAWRAETALVAGHDSLVTRTFALVDEAVNARGQERTLTAGVDGRLPT